MNKDHCPLCKCDLKLEHMLCDIYSAISDINGVYYENFQIDFASCRSCSYDVALLINKFDFTISELFFLKENKFLFSKNTEGIQVFQKEETVHINEVEFSFIKTNKVDFSNIYEEYYFNNKLLNSDFYPLFKNLSYPIDKDYLLKKIKMMEVF